MSKVILLHVAIAPHSTQLASTLEHLEAWLAETVADGLLLERQQVAVSIAGVAEPQELVEAALDASAIERVATTAVPA